MIMTQPNKKNQDEKNNKIKLVTVRIIQFSSYICIHAVDDFHPMYMPHSMDNNAERNIKFVSTTKRSTASHRCQPYEMYFMCETLPIRRKVEGKNIFYEAQKKMCMDACTSNTWLWDLHKKYHSFIVALLIFFNSTQREKASHRFSLNPWTPHILLWESTIDHRVVTKSYIPTTHKCLFPPFLQLCSATNWPHFKCYLDCLTFDDVSPILDTQKRSSYY